MKKLKSILGPHSPWLWQLEPVWGCNLRCWHCAARTMKGSKTFITQETWAAAMKIIAAVTPACRVEIAMSGEPTLHPDLTTLLWMSRKVSPWSQLGIITNGTKLISGEVTYRDLFKAGLNTIYVDMYAPREEHIALARESGYQWVECIPPATMPSGFPSPWAYHGPDVKLITLALPPEHWPMSTRTRGRISTWLGNLDWKAAGKHGFKKLEAPIKRRCNQPFRQVATKATGEYVLCCLDFLGESAGRYGSVHEGVDGFMRFWLGRDIQEARRELRNANRAAINECSRCDFITGRADIVWPKNLIEKYWDGTAWKELP